MSTAAPLATSDNSDHSVHRALCSLRAMGFRVVVADNDMGACTLRTPNGKEIDLFLSEVESYASKMREDLETFKAFLARKAG